LIARITASSPSLFVLCLIGGLLPGQPSMVVAQGASADAASLQGRLDPATRGAVELILDSATRANVPVHPLIRKALEGAAKRAPGERIISAVRTLAADLAVARRALGADADESALAAGVSALRAGVSASSLREFRTVRQPVALAWPLTVLADLVSRGVPTDTATYTILSLARNGATDAAFSSFERQVLHDIDAGVPPGAATVARSASPTDKGPATRMSGEPPPAPRRGMPPPSISAPRPTRPPPGRPTPPKAGGHP